MKTRFKTLLLIFTILGTIPSFSQTYVVDAGHSSFQSKVIRFGVVPVVGRFKDVSGTITYDENDLSKTSASITIKVDSYDANSVGGEEAVKSDAFLNASAYPEIRFELNSLAGTDGNYVAKGMLEIHGVKKQIECPISIVGPSIDLPTRKQSVGFMGALTIDRTEFEVGKEMKLPNGMVIIDNAVNIDFVILGIAQ
ncbi:YceI family protein [Ekhidna sp.]